jgi:hypothetical protein
MHVYLVVHEKIPNHRMRIHKAPCSERIKTINSSVVGVYSSFEMANNKAYEYFHEDLELECTDDECDEGCYYWSSIDGGGDINTFDESVFVKRVRCN